MEIRLSEKELSDKWGISYRTLGNWRATGKGPAYFKVGAKVFYHLEDVLAYENSQKVKPLNEA